MDTGSTWRGGQQQVYLLHRELLGRGLPSRLLALQGGELVARCRAEGLDVTDLPGDRPWQPTALAAVLRNLAGVGIVHAHDSHAADLGAVLRHLRRDLRLVCHRRVSYPIGGNPLSRWKYGKVDAWIAVSGEVARAVKVSGVPGARVRVVHSALDLERFRAKARGLDVEALRQSLDIPAGAPVVGFCAAFSPQKGHGVLLAAARAVLARQPETVFLLPGEGDLRGQILKKVETEGLAGSFRLPGFRRDVSALTALFTVGVVPSVDGEGSSASIKEPMALGVPVVASDLGGNLEVLGGAGLTYPNRDPAWLARRILEVLDDPELRRELGQRGRARSEAFAPSTMAEGVLETYRSLSGGEG